jgi:cellulose synthase (UDP-forming)/cellulose synthase operon protein B
MAPSIVDLDDLPLHDIPTAGSFSTHAAGDHRSRDSMLVNMLLIALGAAGLGLLIIFPLGWKEQMIAGGALIGAAAALSSASSSSTATLTLMIVSLFSTLRYGFWRVMQTWDGITSAGHLHQWDTIVVLLLLGAEFYAFATLALGYFQTVRPLRRRPLPLDGDPRGWPTVDVFIPTFNEPLRLVRATVLGTLALDYPADKLRITVLDDGGREEFRVFAAAVGVGYIARPRHDHAKAGNINHALTLTSGEFVAIFDCDHVPTRSFLALTLGWLVRDARLGLVQTPHHFYSPDPFERNLGQFRKVPNEGALFHRLVQDGNDLWNASFFCGSCAVLRRSALAEIGGVAVETVTEDAHTALRMQRRGWHTAYINVPQAAGLATESLAAHIGQRIRWARGMAQILRVENPLRASGLSLAQRLCYFNAASHFLFAVPRLIFLTVPLCYLLFGVVNIYGYSLSVLAYALPHIALSHLTNSRVQHGFRGSFWNEIYEAALAPYILLPTLLALVNPRLGKFNVTSKGGVVERSYFDRRVALPLILLLGLNIAGLVMAGQRYATDAAHRDTVVMNALWTIYNIAILSVAASVALERRQRRSEVRVDVGVPMTLVAADGSMLAGTSIELSCGGAAGRFDRRLRLRRGENVRLILQAHGSRCEIPARVTRSTGRIQRLSFPRLDMPQERQLIALIYARPGAWTLWEHVEPVPGVLGNAGRVLWLSIRGLAVVAIGFFLPRFGPRRRRGDAFEDTGRAAGAASATLLAGVLLAAIAMPAPAHAQTAGTPAPSAFDEQYEFNAIGAPASITWRDQGASLNLFLSVPVTKIVRTAVLVLHYAAPRLGAEEAQLQLWLNGTRIGVVTLAGGDDVRTEVPLPTDLFTTDNTMTLRLDGRCAGCARSRAPWVTLDPASSLHVSGTRLPLTNDLSLLPVPFLDPSGQRSWTLPVVFAEPPDHSALQAAAVVASWVGVLSDVRGVRFPVSVGDVPDGNALVIGRRETDLLSGLSLPAQGAFIAMRDNPRDPFGKLLVVSGRRTADLLMAARALATSTRIHEHASAVAALETPLPARGEYDAPRWLKASVPAPIGMYTSADRLTLRGTGSIDIYFRLPPDLFLAARQSVPLQLKFSYAGVEPGARASLHVRLNGEDIDTIRLKPSSTPIERAETVRLPTGWLRSYTNTLTVDVDFGHHSPSTLPYAAVHRDSTIDLRALPHAVVLPRLELFADAGYPFTQWPDLGRTSIVLPESPSLDDYEALLNVAGFFGAQTGSPVTALKTIGAAHVDMARDDDLVLLGTRASQPLLQEWAGLMPLDVSGQRVRLTDRPDVFRQLLPAWPFGIDDRDRLARLVDSATMVDAFIEGFVSPFRPDRSIVALVPNGGDGRAAIAALLMPATRKGPVYGALSVAQGGQFQSFLVDHATYHAGDFNTYQRTAVFVVEHYWLIPMLAVLLALAMGSRARQITERVAARRLRVGGTTAFLVLALSLLAAAPAGAQSKEGVDVLLGKARSLEARGRMDLAVQSWNQVLLVDPNQTEALGGLARYARLNGDATGERAYLDRLRKINPNDPAIAAVQKFRVLSPQDRSRLDEAGRLAGQHKPDEAMKIYQAVLGSEAPPGKYAEAYYETEAASTGGRDKAVRQLRELTTRDPRNEAYRLWLARILTYDARSRMEAFKLLESIQDAGTVEQARSVWRRALEWEKDNPAVQETLETYVRRYPDAELQKVVDAFRAKRERAIRDANEQQAFQALRGKDTETAQNKFEDILRRAPDDVNALAGLAFVRLDQKRFEQALTLFDRARTRAPQRTDLRDGYTTAKFWLAMQRGSDLQRSEPDTAIAAYQDALTLHPQDPQPVLGIAQILLRQGRLDDAGARFSQVMTQMPGNVEAVAGLGYVRLDEKKFDEAATLLGQARSLAPNRKDVDEAYRSARFWGLMNEGAVALEKGRGDAAFTAYGQALEFNPGAKDAMIGLAAAADRARNHAEAIAAYQRLTAAHPDEPRGWLGLLTAQVGASHPEAAIGTVRQIPPAMQTQLASRADYPAIVALAFYNAHQAPDGERWLRRALEVAGRADTDEALGARLQVAGLFLREKQAARAIELYRQAAESRPNNAVAWQGLIAAYADAHDTSRAMAAVRAMPRPVYDVAMKSPESVNAIATVYAADGRCGEAEGLLNRSLSLDKDSGRPPAETTRLQLAGLWMREQQYERAGRAYQEIVLANGQSVEAWRGYVTALHNSGNDRMVVSETVRIPSETRAALLDDTGLLSLLAAAHAKVGRHEDAVKLFTQARARYRAAQSAAPAALDIQFGWELLAASGHEGDLKNLLLEVKMRTDLSPAQRETVDEMRSLLAVRSAEAALKSQGPERAAAILVEAGQEEPHDPRVRSALAGLYLQQRQYEKVLDLYRSWGMAGADAGEYRLAAGAAVMARQDALVDTFLFEGRQRFPDDAELLRMTGRQYVTAGKYRDGERYLKSALTAARQPATASGRVPSRNATPAPMIADLAAPPAEACRTSNWEGLEIAEPQVAEPQSGQAPQVDARAESQEESGKDAQQLQDEIDVVQHRNTPLVSVGSPVTIRSGDPGINRLSTVEGVLGATAAIENSVRVAVNARTVSLSSGAPDGRSTYRFGTLPLGAAFPEQSASGQGGDIQLSGNLFGAAAGLTGHGFLRETWTAGLRLGPLNGPVQLIAVRDNVKDSLLSYAGTRDPGTGIIWGGVVSNSASLQLAHNDGGSGQYLSATGALLRGHNVINNWEAEAAAGAYWTVATASQGSLTLGLSATGMHYDKNSNFFTLGHGGYFSPQQYAVASVPISWSGRQPHVTFEITASAGYQYIVEDAAPYYPTRGLSVQPTYDGSKQQGVNYNVSARVDYHIAPHWYLGSFVSANNARAYQKAAAGVTLTFLAQRLPTSTGLHPQQVPDWRGAQPLKF